MRRDGKYTYEDYLKWPEGEHWELLHGVAYLGPAPSRAHQEVSTNLVRELSLFFKGGPCRVYHAPFDVRLTEDGIDEKDCNNVVQPDVSVICQEDQLDERGCKGAPDLIIEIVSPSSASLDYIKKKELYERHGVKEYWIIHPIDQILQVYTLKREGHYGIPKFYSSEDRVTSSIFIDLLVDLREIF